MAELVHFSVSQIRVAATCPRILYFDLEETRRRRLRYPRVSRIWKEGSDDVTACGTLFHNAIEAFNSQAALSGKMLRLLKDNKEGTTRLEQELRQHIYQGYVKRKELFQAEGPQQQAFIQSLHIYVRELADILSYALTIGMKPKEIVDQMFGDRRRRVDVTFDVGKNGAGVHVTGQLDYVFYDWRVARRRIIDYKLTPGDDPSNDLFQVALYGLMHHVQHQTEPDVAVFYLHPRRQMFELKWEELFAQRHKIYDLLASMAAWASFDERAGTGLKPPGEPCYCAHCPWNDCCTQRLGLKSEGGRLNLWAEKLKAEPLTPTEPHIETAEINEPAADGLPGLNEVFDAPSEAVADKGSAVRKIPVAGTPGSGCRASRRHANCRPCHAYRGRRCGGQRQDLVGQGDRRGSNPPGDFRAGGRSARRPRAVHSSGRPRRLSRLGAGTLRSLLGIGRASGIHARIVARDSALPESAALAENRSTCGNRRPDPSSRGVRRHVGHCRRQSGQPRAGQRRAGCANGISGQAAADARKRRRRR